MVTPLCTHTLQFVLTHRVTPVTHLLSHVLGSDTPPISCVNHALLSRLALTIMPECIICLTHSGTKCADAQSGLGDSLVVIRVGQCRARGQYMLAISHNHPGRLPVQAQNTGLVSLVRLIKARTEQPSHHQLTNAPGTSSTHLKRRIPFGDEDSNVKRVLLLNTNSAMNLSSGVVTSGESA
eukprot:1159718-Pelagomonas_calceolata.AAC.12